MRDAIGRIPDGEYSYQDRLDDDGITDEPVPIAATITIEGESATVDFAGSAAQVRGSVNAVYAVTVSAVAYVLRTLAPDDTPMNAGAMRPITVLAPEGSVVNATPPAAVAAGNVETSQRIVDVLLGALAAALPDMVPAASYGTMSNMTLGGTDPRSGAPFAYYETIAGGMGARPTADGLDAVHCHMTNTLNTPIEALEFSAPVRDRVRDVDHGGPAPFRAIRPCRRRERRAGRGYVAAGRRGAAAPEQMQRAPGEGRHGEYPHAGGRRVGRGWRRMIPQ